MSEKPTVVEPGLEGTLIGKIRALMRDLDMGHLAPIKFYDALERAGLKVEHRG